MDVQNIKNMESPKPIISVIVPVYNAEPYLQLCVKSVLTQSFANFELLLIDDGSTDNSGSVCDKFACYDRRVRVFHKENGGVSSARNLGIDKAWGGWITFLDSDDFIDTTFLEDLYGKAISSHVDIVFTDIRYIWSNKTDIYYTYRWNETPQEDLVAYLTQTRNCPGWGLIRGSLIRNNNFRFPENITIYEDFHLLIRLIFKSQNVCHVGKPLYNYRMHDSSIVHSTDYNYKIQNQIWAYSSILQYFKDNNVYDKYAPSLYGRILHDYQNMVLDRTYHENFTKIYPDKKYYIWKSSTINFKLKIMMWCLTHHMGWFTRLVVIMREWIKEVKV